MNNVSKNQMVEAFIQKVHDKFFTENDNIRWLLIIPGETKQLSEILTDFDVGQYKVQFTHMEGSVWYAKVGGSGHVITMALKRKLKHSNFVLFQFADAPGVHPIK